MPARSREPDSASCEPGRGLRTSIEAASGLEITPPPDPHQILVDYRRPSLALGGPLSTPKPFRTKRTPLTGHALLACPGKEPAVVLITRSDGCLSTIRSSETARSLSRAKSVFVMS